MARILMCRPEHYGIEYEINPWMNRKRQVDHEQAVSQWEALYELLASLGAEIELLEPVRGLPDLVFTANAGMVFGSSVILSRFRHPQRQGEEPVFAEFFLARDFAVTQLPPERYFEGAGDALFCGATLFGGYHVRSDAASQQRVAELIQRRVLPLELVDPYYYHLDTCFCPLDPETVVYYPPAFDSHARQVIASEIPRRIEVGEEEAKVFACNAVVIGRTVVTNVGCPELHAALRREGFAPVATPLGEFIKAGGSAKCLTLRLDGEEAAVWDLA